MKIYKSIVIVVIPFSKSHGSSFHIDLVVINVLGLLGASLAKPHGCTLAESHRRLFWEAHRSFAKSLKKEVMKEFELKKSAYHGSCSFLQPHENLSDRNILAFYLANICKETKGYDFKMQCSSDENYLASSQPPPHWWRQICPGHWRGSAVGGLGARLTALSARVGGGV